MAYGGGTIPTLAQLITGKFIPETYSTKVLDHTKSALVIANRVNTEYRDDLKVGSKVNIGLMSELTTAEVTPGTVPTAINGVGTPTSITVDKWRVAATDISDLAQIEDLMGYFSKAAKSAAYAIAKDVDTYLGALFSTLASSSVYGSAGQTLTDDIILAIMQTLDEADIPEDDRSIITDPSSKVDLLKIDKFIKNDYVRELVVPTGKFGNLYNMGVFITNNLTAASAGNYGAMLHKDAIGLAIQKSPRSQATIMPGQFRTLLTCDVIFGLGVLRSTFGKSFYTRSS